jgi:hypothetical protein
MSKFSIVNLDGKVQWCSLLDAVYWIDIAIIMGQNVFENIRGTMGYTAIFKESRWSDRKGYPLLTHSEVLRTLSP